MANIEDFNQLKNLLIKNKARLNIDELTYQKFLENIEQVISSSVDAYSEESQTTFSHIEKLLQNTEIHGEIADSTEPTSAYRTQKKSGRIFTKYPSALAVPTVIKYQYAISLFEKGYAYLCPNYDTSNLKFKDGKIFFDGSEPLRLITEAELVNYKTNESITDINGLPILRAYYSILLASYEEAMKKGEDLPETLALYVPDLAEYLGLGRKINDKTIQSIMSQFHSFDNVISVIKSTSSSGKIRKSYFPVLSFLGYDADTNTIHISSLYLWKVIDRIYKTSIRRDKKSQPKLKRDGTPLLLPSHSYVIKPSITREKNQAAVENVVIIVTTIEQAGSNTPHIRASTIIERNPQFQERLNESKNPNQLLQRVFNRTWKLLRDQTNLSNVYKDIHLPDPEDSKNIPTLKTLDMVFEFPHEGKVTAVNPVQVEKVVSRRGKSAHKKTTEK